MSVTSSQPSRGKSRLWSLAKVILGLLLVLFVFSRTSLAELVSLASRVSWAYFGLTVALFLLMSILKAWQYHVLLNSRLPYPQTLSVIILQNALSNFVATGAGIAAYMTILKAEQGVKLSRSASVFVLVKIMDMLSLWLGLIFSLVFIWKQIPVIYVPVLLLIAIIGAGLLVFGMGLLNRQRFAAMFRHLLEGAGLMKFGVVKRSSAFLDSLAEFDQKELFRLVGAAGQLSFLYFIATIVWSYFSLRTFALPVSLPVVVFVTAMLQLLSIVPIQVFGGLGVNEAASLYLFGLFGFTSAELAAVLIGTRLLFYLTNLVALLYLPLHSLFLVRLSQHD